MLYLAVTADRLELPIAVAGSVSELAQMIGTSPKVISVAASREHSGRIRGYKILKINEENQEGESEEHVGQSDCAH